MNNELKHLHEIVFTLIEQGIFENIDKGLPFYYFIMDKNGNELLPIQYRECSSQEKSVKYGSCNIFWKKQLELAKIMKDVVFAKCYAKFGTLLIPLTINNKFVGIIGGCIPKRNIPQRAVEKSISLFRGISKLIELMGNKEFYAKRVIDGLSYMLNDLKKGYSIEDKNSIFYSPIKTIQGILKEFERLFESRDSYVLLRTGNVEEYLLIDGEEHKIIKGNEGVLYYIKSLHNREELNEDNPLFQIKKIEGIIFSIEAGIEKYGYFFISKKYLETKPEIEEFIILIINMFTSIYSNYILFNKINIKGEEIYDNEIINFYNLENIVYSRQMRIKSSFINKIDSVLDQKISIYYKDNVSSRDTLYRLIFSNENISEKYFHKKALIEKKYISYFDNNLYTSSEIKNKAILELIYELFVSQEVVNKTKNMYYSYIYTLISGYQFREPFKLGKNELLRDLCEKVATLVNLKSEQIEKIKYAIYFMDIGLIGIPDNVLNKKGELNDKDMEKIKRHPYITESLLIDFPHFENILDIVQSHHENWDGTGYPQGLKGEEIPIEARIIHLADSFVSMISPRKFRAAFPAQEAMKIIEKNKNKEFDPNLVEKFRSIISND